MLLTMLMLFTVPASAEAPAFPDTKVAKGMAPLDVLLVKDAIRESWAQYTLLIDGDGVTNDNANWAERTFTKDLKWEWYDANGKLVQRITSMAEMRDRMKTESFLGTHPESMQSYKKHLPITIKFDEVTPTTAKTRTIVVMLSVPKSKVQGGPDGVPGLDVPGIPQVGMAVYHDTWRKEDGHWLKSVSILHSANLGFFPAGFMPSKSLPMPPG